MVTCPRYGYRLFLGFVILSSLIYYLHMLGSKENGFVESGPPDPISEYLWTRFLGGALNKTDFWLSPRLSSPEEKNQQTTANPLNTTDMIYPQQVLRKQQLKQMCDSVKKEFSNHNSEHWNKGQLGNFLVKDDHRIIYCYIPKVACTNWKRILYVLANDMPPKDFMSIEHEEVHNPSKISHLGSVTMADVKKKLKLYTKFLFVRDPFVRLISAYRDKLQRYKKSFYDRYGRPMLLRYGKYPNPPQTMKEVLASGVYPSFHNFVQYLVDPRTRKPFDEHWRPMHEMCHPCAIQYDFIGHQETLQEDAEQLLKILKLDDDFKFPPAYEHVTTKSFLQDWFKPVSIEDRRKLYQIYEMDFKLFGYPKPVELLDG